jgi:DNA-binding transcriptional LysR family regulator
MFTWDDLKHFLEFARKGSILAAAKTQGVNHSTVYRRLANLEKSLGHRLIERRLTGYRLTELGLGLLPYAERVEEAIAACDRYLASCDQALSGTVRVTCTPHVGERLKNTPLFETFHTRFPGLRIELMLSDRLVDLSKREADIAIRSLETEIADEALVGYKIAEGTWAVYASRSYVERHGRPACSADIARHRVVKSEYSAGWWLGTVAPHATVAAYSESSSGVVVAVKSGVGIAPLPTVVGDAESELVRVIDDVPEMSTHFYLLIHPDMQRVPRVRAFSDFVVSEIRTFRTALVGHPERRIRAPKSPAIDLKHGTHDEADANGADAAMNGIQLARPD